MNKKSSISIKIIFGIVTVFFGIVFFAWTVVPYIQIGKYYDLVREMKRAVFEIPPNDSFVFSPNTYVQEELRTKFLFSLIQEYEDNKQPKGAVLFAVNKLEEIAKHNQDSATLFLSIGRGYAYLARTNTDSVVFPRKAEENYKKALELWPNSQEIIKEYSLVLTSIGKPEEAITILRNEINLNPNVLEMNSYLGMALYRGGPQYYNDSLLHFEKALQNWKMVNNELTINIYKNLFAYYYRLKDLDRFMTVVQRLEQIDPQQKVLYDQIELYILKTGKLPNINIE